jgi:hypothetical protein
LPIRGNLKTKPNFTCNMKEQPIGILLFLSQSRKRVKVTLEQAKRPSTGVDYSSTLSLTLVVEGEGGQHMPWLLYPGKDLVPIV